MPVGTVNPIASLRLDSQQAMEWPEPFDASVAEKLVVMPGTDGAAVAQYRGLADALLRARTERHLKTVMITSGRRGEGRTLTAVNLALTLSHSCGQRVLLVDADLTQPAVHSLLGASLAPGLLDYLVALPEAGPMPVIGLTAGLSLLPAGHARHLAAGSCDLAKLGRLLVEAGAAFDWVIVDSAPFGNSAETALLAAIVDTAVLVIGSDKAQSTQMEHAVRALGRERVLGIVLNRARATG